MSILDDIEGWVEQKLEHSDDPTAHRENENVKAFTTTIEQRKSQQHVQFGAYAKLMVKKFCSLNPNEATDEFDYAPSRPEKQRIDISYAAALATPFNRSKYIDSISEDIDLTSKEPSLITGFTNAPQLLKLERSIT
jgi:hypothetical protein